MPQHPLFIIHIMTSKKKLLYLSLIALFPGLTRCSIAETANVAKSKIVNVSKKDTKKVKERKVSGSKPNIVIIITVDQVYGDLGCSGSPIIKTPHTDKLANELVWLTDYHVAPTCSPTRAVLMSGHWTNRTEDRGFTRVYRHGGGGVGQTPDVWDNAYFDGGYFHN